MVEKIQAWLRTPAGRLAGLGLAVIAVGFLVWNLMSAFGEDPAAAATNTRVFIDSQTGKTFNVSIRDLQPLPLVTPAGTKTGYPAEACFWTKDGGIKSEPTFVFVKEYAGIHEATYCPDCGRLVVQLNPSAMPGRTPPPLKKGK